VQPLGHVFALTAPLRPRAWGGQAAEILLFELVKTQHPRERLEDLRRGVLVAAALEPLRAHSCSPGCTTSPSLSRCVSCGSVKTSPVAGVGMPAFPGTTHAGFSYAVPVADREPADVHALSITYSAADRVARWYVGGTEALVMDSPGRRLPDGRHLMRDNGRPDEAATPGQLTCGAALFASRLWGQGLRLSVREIALTRDGGAEAGTESQAEPSGAKRSAGLPSGS
jgi:hypothetical protein